MFAGRARTDGSACQDGSIPLVSAESIVALARWLAVIMHSILVDGTGKLKILGTALVRTSFLRNRAAYE